MSNSNEILLEMKQATQTAVLLYQDTPSEIHTPSVEVLISHYQRECYFQMD